MVAVTADFVFIRLGFGDPSILPYSAHTMVRPLYAEMNMMCVDLDPLVFILHFASQLCIASKLVCSLREAMAGSMSAAITALSSAKVANVVSSEISRSSVKNR
jgi:hypothetical protein